MILGINTALTPYTLGLRLSNGKLIERSLPDRYDSAENLIDHIETFLSDFDASFEALTAIGVLVGPGGYTGLRLGVTTAKTMAQIQETPIYGFNTLDAIAHQHRDHDGVVMVVTPSIKGEVNVSIYAAHNQDQHAVLPHFTWDIATCVQKVQYFEEAILITGVFPAGLKEDLEKNPNCRVVDAVLYGSSVAELASEQLAQDESGALDTVQVLYNHAAV